MQLPLNRRRSPGLSIGRTTIDSRVIGIIVVIAVLIYLVIGPAIMLVVTSFKLTENRLPFESGTPLTLSNYTNLILDPSTYPVLLTTLIFVVGSLAIGMSIAIALSWLIERTDLPAKNGVFVLLVGSTGIPTVISAIAWALLLNPSNGMINLVIRGVFGLDGRGPINVYSVAGLFAVQGIAIVPISVLLITASFRSMDAVLEDAARASGAHFWTVMRRVTLPLMLPAILSAIVYEFVTVVESFDIPLVLGLNSGITVLSTKIYSEIHPPLGLPDYGMASAYGMLLLLVALIPLVVYNRLTRETERFATVSGHGYSARMVRLGRWRWPTALVVWGFIFMTVILPLFVMVWTSVQPYYQVPSLEAIERISFRAYAIALSRPTTGAAFLNTTILGVATGLFTMIISVLVSWIVVRIRSRLRIAVDALAFLPHAMPGVILGLAVLLIYITLPLPIFGTIWIIVIALTTQYIALGSRLMNSAIAQIDRQLEEVAGTSGATWPQTLRRVTLPLVTPAFFNGFLLVLLSSIKNLTQPLILFAPGSIVFSTLIWDRWSYGDTAGAATLGVGVSVATMLLALALRRGSGSAPA